MIFKRKAKQVDEVIKSYLTKSQDPRKTYVVAVVHKRNKKLYNVVTELGSEVITIDGTPYYAGTDALFYRREKINKKEFDIPFVDVYEDYTLAVHPSQNANDVRFSKRVIDMIALKLEQGILENKRRNKIDLRKIIIGIMIGGAAIYIIANMF